MKETPFLLKNEYLIEKLHDVPTLRGFKREELMEMLALSKMRTYEPGEVVIQEGVFDLWIYFLIKGRVEVEKEGKKLFELRRKGDIFGEMSVIDGSPRSATIRAKEETSCLAVDASLLDRLSAESHTTFHYVMYRLFAEILADRLRHTSHKLARMQKGNIR